MPLRYVSAERRGLRSVGTGGAAVRRVAPAELVEARGRARATFAEQARY